jgi:hypothetical protein
MTNGLRSGADAIKIVTGGGVSGSRTVKESISVDRQ